MKRTIAFLLGALLLICQAGCGGKPSDDNAAPVEPAEEIDVKDMLAEKWDGVFPETAGLTMILDQTVYGSTEPVKEITYRLMNETSGRWNYGERCLLLYRYQEEWYVTRLGPLTSNAVLYDLMPDSEEKETWYVTPYKDDAPCCLLPGSYRLVKELYPYEKTAGPDSVILFAGFSVE